MMSSKAQHIVIVSSEFPPQPGGIGNHAYQLAKALSYEGCKVTVITDERSDSGSVEKIFDKNLPYVVWRIRKRTPRMFMYVERFISVFKAMKSADKVIASGKFSLWVVAFCTIFRKRFSMAVIHGTEVNLPSGIFRNLVALSLKRFNVIVAVSDYTKQLIMHLNLRVNVIHNGIALDDWQDEVLIFDEDKLFGYPNLITVGRVSERKGQMEVVKLLPELLKQFPKLHYHCIGINDEVTSVMALTKHLDVEKHVSFHGVLEKPILKNYLAQSDIFIMFSKPSNGDVEGFGIAILEANAMGIPAIGAFGSGVEEAIKAGQSGILVPLGDDEAFTTAVRDILNNKEPYKQGAISWAEAHNWNIIIKQYIALLS
ncbi:MAG: glycosyltransferase family 4 protein [Flavobacteriales bacterium]